MPVVASLKAEDKLVLALLALAGEPMGAVRIKEHLAAAGLPGLDAEASIARLRKAGVASTITGRGYAVAPDAAWPAIKHAIDSGILLPLRQAYEECTPLRKNWQGFFILRSYRQGIALLRMALFGRDDPRHIATLLTACLECHEAAYLHPLVDICARPFEPEMIDYIHPQLVDEVLTVVVCHVQRDPASAPAVRDCAERHVAKHAASMSLRIVLAEHLILCGRLDDATALLSDLDASLALFFRSVIELLRDGHAPALASFDQALKLLRRETGKRKMCFSGIGGHLYVLALIRAKDPKCDKLAETYLDTATRAVQRCCLQVYARLADKNGVRGRQ